MCELKPCPFCGKNELRQLGVLKKVQCINESCDHAFKNPMLPIAWQTRPIEDAIRAENERLREAVGLLRNWVKAYPLDMFPEPDLKLARKLLTDGGVSYDALNVYSMRHVINGVGRIIDETLNEVREC